MRARQKKEIKRVLKKERRETRRKQTREGLKKWLCEREKHKESEAGRGRESWTSSPLGFVLG